MMRCLGWVRVWARRGAMVLGLSGVVSASGAANAQGADCRYSIRWWEEPPYSMRDASGKIYGIDIDIVTAILERMQCAWHMVELPLARALIELEEGRLDIWAGAYRSAERERYALFSEPIYWSSGSLYMGPEARGKYKLKTLADIIGTDFRLGAQRGSSHGPAYEALRANPRFLERLSPVNSGPGRWKMLAAGRIDGLISEDMEASMELRLLGLEATVVPVLQVENSAASYVAFSRKTISEEFVARFNSLFSQMVADGTYLRIKQRYVTCKPAANPLRCR